MNTYNRKSRAREFRRAGSVSAQTATDKQALAMPTMYPYWAEKTSYGGENDPKIVRRPIEGRNQLFRCQQPHTSQAGWEPENYKAGWVAINDNNVGTVDDPIPAVRGMEFTYDLYYLDPEDGKIYLCKRTGEADGGKVSLQYLPHELVGQYFEEAAA